MFSDTCRFEMFAWGWKKNMTLIDLHEWHLEEGTYYEDFSLQPVEYRGPTHETEFGFEPIDQDQWVPDYDVFSTTEPSDIMTTTRRVLGGMLNSVFEIVYLTSILGFKAPTNITKVLKTLNNPCINFVMRYRIMSEIRYKVFNSVNAFVNKIIL